MAQKTSAKPVKSTLLDKKFWQNFAKNFWEKKPLVLKNVKAGLIEIGEDEVFKLLVLYADHCRRLNNPEGFKFYIDGFKAEAEDVLQVLPEKTDKSLLGYHKRMKDLFSDYCLVCDELLTVNQKKQHLLTDFTGELYRHVGFPNRFSEMGLYLGNYRKTPFGVHVDSCGVFSFPVAGTKRFRLWTDAFAKKNPGLDRAFKYDKYKESSLLLEVNPGDMAYWPSSAWHIAESDGSFSATWSLGVWVDQPHKEMIADSFKELLETKFGHNGLSVTTPFKTLHNAAGEVTELPEVYRKSIELLQNVTALELQEAFLKSWMRHISLQGFKNIPRCDFKITTKSKIQLRQGLSPILWQQSLTEKEKYYLSFGGILVGTKSTGLLGLVKSLNAGSPGLVSTFIKGATQKQDLISLQTLANAGAFAIAT